MWYTLVIGLPDLFANGIDGKGKHWQIISWSQKHYDNRRDKASGRVVHDARLLMKQLHARGFTHLEVRIMRHATRDFPQHGKQHTIAEVEDGQG